MYLTFVCGFEMIKTMRHVVVCNCTSCSADLVAAWETNSCTGHENKVSFTIREQKCNFCSQKVLYFKVSFFYLYFWHTNGLTDARTVILVNWEMHPVLGFCAEVMICCKFCHQANKSLCYQSLNPTTKWCEAVKVMLFMAAYFDIYL